MKWSKYNVFIQSAKHGLLLYNGITDTFVALDETGREEIERIGCNPDEYDPLDNLLLYQQLRKGRMLVSDGEEDEVRNRLALRRRHRDYDNTILSLTIVPTLHCNFDCTYCYQQHKRLVRMEDGTESELLEFIKRLKGVRQISVTWFGGEPLLEFDRIMSLSEKFESLGAPFEAMMVTNGYLLNAKVASRLKALRVQEIQVTIDGSEKIHDMRRILAGGGKTYARILKNLKNLMALWDGRLRIRANIDIHNREEFAQINERLVQEFKGTDTFIYPGIVSDSAQNNPDLICPFSNSQEGAFFIDQYWAHGFASTMFSAGTGFNGCIATQRNGFVIGPVGEVYKCWYDVGNPKMVAGNIKEDRWDLNLLTRYMVGVDVHDDPECEQCLCRTICGGGCPNRRLRRKYLGEDLDVCTGFKDHLEDYLAIAYEIRKRRSEDSQPR